MLYFIIKNNLHSNKTLRPRDLNDLVPRMAQYCNVPSEARVILKVGSRAERGTYLGPEGH